jgi:hypothetical protein
VTPPFSNNSPAGRRINNSADLDEDGADAEIEVGLRATTAEAMTIRPKQLLELWIGVTAGTRPCRPSGIDVRRQNAVTSGRNSQRSERGAAGRIGHVYGRGHYGNIVREGGDHVNTVAGQDRQNEPAHHESSESDSDDNEELRHSAAWPRR